MTDVFVSYKREDKPIARTLVESLRRSGFVAWWDEDIPPGAPWEATIAAHLEAASAVVVVWTRSSVGSENVLSEARSARTAGKLIQVIADDISPPLFFGEHQAIDIRRATLDPVDDRFSALCDAIAALKRGERAVVPLLPRRRRGRWRRLVMVGGAMAACGLAVGLFRQEIGAYLYQSLPRPAGERLDYLTDVYLNFRPSGRQTPRARVAVEFPSDPKVVDVLGRSVATYTRDSSAKLFTVYTRFGECSMHLVNLSRKFHRVLAPFLQGRFSVVILDVSEERDRDRAGLIRIAKSLGPDFFVIAPDDELTRKLARSARYFYQRVPGSGDNVTYDIYAVLMFFTKSSEYLHHVAHFADFRPASASVLDLIMDAQPFEVAQSVRSQLTALAAADDLSRVDAATKRSFARTWLEGQAKLASIDLDDNARSC